MNANDEKRFAVLVGVLSVVFEKGDYSEEKISLYFDFLKDIPFPAVERGVKSLINNRKFPSFPTVAEIREAAHGDEQQELEDEALVGWGRLNRKGTFARVDGDRLDQAVKMLWGAWDKWADGDPKNNSYEWPHFLACWKAIARAEKKLLELERARGELEEPKK
jgi:hypothetical protein